MAERRSGNLLTDQEVVMSTATQVPTLSGEREASAGRWWTTGFAVVALIALLRLFLHLLTANRYGIFRDELYYLACAEHLDWGYVDQPPLIALLAWIARHLFGNWLVGLRFFPALAGAATVWLTAKLAREMGGGAFAQFLAALAVICVPI